VILAALGLSDLVEIGGKTAPQGVPGAALAMLAAWLPAILIAVIWFVGLKEWQWLNAYADAQPAQYSFWSKANLLYYPRLLVSQPVSLLTILLCCSAGLSLIKLPQQARLLIKAVSAGEPARPIRRIFAFGLALLTYVLQDSPRFGMLLFRRSGWAQALGWSKF